MTKTGLGKVLGLATLLSMMGSGLSGCDYWPPALQAEIEQLRTELQTTTAEKSRLERQLADMTKAKDDLQIRVEDLSRLNRERQGQITTLEANLAAEREKVAKLTKGPAKKTPAKTSAKTSAKKKPTKGSTQR
jgi:chromosome segregation ATPase